MESTQRLIRTWVASGRDQEIQETVSGITSGQISLLIVVKALGEFLTAEEDDLRTKGVEFLSAVLSACPSEIINRQHTHVLIAFYCGKLDDTETVIPALKGLRSLVSLPSCVAEDTVDVLNAIFKYVKMRGLDQPARFIVYSIIELLLIRHREAVKSMGKEFLSRYSALAEGEKDPRNLIVAFTIARIILVEFDISEFVESFFNITFCYFPISFRPPPEYKANITADDLKSALLGCLSATPAFGPLAIPLFLEKLMAGSPATKRDTLQTMAFCIPIYGPETCRASADKMWKALKLEIFMSTDPMIEEEAVKTVQILIKTLYASKERKEGEFDANGLVRLASEECMKALRHPEERDARPAALTLCAFVATTPSVARFTLTQAIPHLVKTFNNPEEALHRPPCLMLLADFLLATRNAEEAWARESVEESDDLLGPFKDELLGVLTVGLNVSSCVEYALKGLRAMVTTKGLLTDEENGFVVLHANSVLLEEIEKGYEHSDSIMDLLSSVADKSPRQIETQTLPSLFALLPDNTMTRDDIQGRAKCWRVLSALSKLCIRPDLFGTLVIRLSTKLDLLCVPSSSPTPDVDVEPAAAYAHSVLATLAKTLGHKIENNDVDVSKYIDRLVPQLYHLFIWSALSPDSHLLASSDHRVIAITGQTINYITQVLPTPQQEAFAALLFPAFLEGKYSFLTQGHQVMPENARFRPFESSAPDPQKNTVALFAAAVVALDKKIALPLTDLSNFCSMLLKWSLDSANTSLQFDAGCSVLSSILNKRTIAVSAFLSTELEQFWAKQIVSSELPVERRRKAVKVWARICKALLVQHHTQAASLTDRLLDLADDSDLSWDAARVIGDLCGSDSVLTKRNHAVIKMLYAQKLFNRLLPRIFDGAKSSDSRRQTAHLVALTSLMKTIPKGSFEHELPELMPLLLRSLELPDADMRASLIDTLAAVAKGNSATIVSQHATTLVQIMLKNSLAKNMPSPKVRIAALRYLSILPRIVRYDILHPYKANVLRELSEVLDDPKRSVRKEAVDARAAWYKFGGRQ